MHYVFCNVIGSQRVENQSHCKTHNASLYLPCIVSIFTVELTRVLSRNVVKDMENIKTDGNLRASIMLEVVEADGSRSRSLTPTPRSRQNSIRMSSQLSTDIDYDNENLNNTIEILTNAEKLSVVGTDQNKNLVSKKNGLVSNLRAHFEEM